MPQNWWSLPALRAASLTSNYVVATQSTPFVWVPPESSAKRSKTLRYAFTMPIDETPND
jgi:hypothetical protein